MRRKQVLTITMICLISFCCIVSARASQAQITVPAGFVVDQLAPRLDNATPRLTAISNPAYGFGVVTASSTDGIVTIRRVSPGNAQVLAVITELDAGTSVVRTRFDQTDLFANLLHVSIRDASPICKLYVVHPDGQSELKWTHGNTNNALVYDFDFTDGTADYLPGAYLQDTVGVNGTALATMNESYVVTVRSNDSLPAGRTDIDIWGLQFDTTGVYGNQLLMADSDPNNDNITAIYALLPDLSWVEISTPVTTQTRFYGDMSISTGGALGQTMYVTDSVSDSIMTVAPDGTHTVWATGFLAVSSVSAAPDGDALYVSDFNGVYKIRLAADEPGPTILMREPFAPNDGPFTNEEGVSFARLIWSDGVEFTATDIDVTDAEMQPVPFSASGSGSAIMIISFGQTLLNDTYSITISDVVQSINGVAIDGDNDGIAGGDAVFAMTHQADGCAADLTFDGDVNAADLAQLLGSWGPCE